MAQWSLVDLAVLCEVPQSHSAGTPPTSDRPLADNTQHTRETGILSPRRDLNPQYQKAGGRSPTP